MSDLLLSLFKLSKSPPSWAVEYRVMLAEWITFDLCTMTSTENCGLHCYIHPLLPEDKKKVSIHGAAFALFLQHKKAESCSGDVMSIQSDTMETKINSFLTLSINVLGGARDKNFPIHEHFICIYHSSWQVCINATWSFFFFFKRMGEILITVEANNLIWFKLVSVSFEKESIYIL